MINLSFQESNYTSLHSFKSLVLEGSVCEYFCVSKSTERIGDLKVGRDELLL